jgi:NAD-dependent dihydropyrimidine dehydrogenase PreA subunit
MKEKGSYTQQSAEAEELKSFVKGLGVDLVGIADVHSLNGMPLGIPSDAAPFLSHYHCAIVMGAQLGKLGKSAPGTEVSLFLERAALAVVDRLERKGRRVLTVHTEDEFDPVNRMGLMSLKVLAKAAGLGWQGRSLLIVSPRYGPIHRWIGVLTDMELRGSAAIPNQCGDCTLCVEVCPAGALNLVEFDDHPVCREDVLDIGLCKGDDGCTECLTVCPWAA